MSRYNQLLQSLDSILQSGDWRSVLLAITNEVIALFKDPRAKAVVFGSPEIDRRCLDAGELAWQDTGVSALPPFDPQLVAYVATELYHRSGGHTLALKDVIRAQPGFRHVILLTNLHDRPLDLQGVVGDMDPAPEIRVAPQGDVAVKLLWLHAQLRELRPESLMLFQHHYDAVAIAGALPQLAQRTFYYHHCDQDMAVGVYLPHAFHVDCSNVMYQRCRDSLGVYNQVYWPLVSPDHGCRAGSRVFMQNGTLTTCSHGSHNKFLSPGRYAYFELIERRLKEVDGIHLHLGHLPDDAVHAFHEKLAENGINPIRFKYIPPVSSLWEFLRDSDVDLCISSFPISGYKGLVETMGAGIPILIHQSTISINYSNRGIVYQQAPWWADPDTFIRQLKDVSPSMLIEQSRLAREHYDAWHHPRELSYAIANYWHSVPPPPVIPYTYDSLALYFR